MPASWARSGRRPPPERRGESRPAGSFAVAVARARGVWDGLTGGPDAVPVGGPGCSCVEPGQLVAVPDGAVLAVVRPHGSRCAAGAGFYSDAAAGAIVSLALGLWADTARGLVGVDGLEGDGDGEDLA